MKKELYKGSYRPITIYEQNVLLPILIKGLEMKKGKMSAVTSIQIVMGMKKHGLNINNTSVNKLINYIRTNDLIDGLMATSLGYFITNSENELINYEATLLCREMALRKVRMSMQRQRRSMFTEDKKVPQKQREIF